jgi:hypothetical protein
MRYSALVLAAAVMIACPAMAAGRNSGPSFAKLPCGAAFSCASYAGLLSSDPRIVNLVAQANSCVGSATSGNLFEDEQGLDSSQCLTTKTMPKNGVGATPTPHCCIVPIGNEKCQLMCELQAIK